MQYTMMRMKYLHSHTHTQDKTTQRLQSATCPGQGAAGTIGYANTRDGGVNRIRILGPEIPIAGGARYTSLSGPAITGDKTSIKLNAQYTGTTAQTAGQRIYIWEGTGRGQYAIVDTFNEVTKVANSPKRI